MAADPKEILIVAGREVAVSNPQKVLFPDAGYTKLDLVRYYLDVAEGALRGAGDRPNVLVRYPNGVGGEFFYQKRAPTARPEWVEVVALKFPSGRVAEEVVPRDAATLAWMANLACLELHPHPVRAHDLDHPDELRVDLDPVRGVPWEQVRDTAKVVQETLADFGLVGWPKTSGSRGMHVCIRIDRKWKFVQVRRAALALAREVERRAPQLATSKWWKEERHGVFVDYNQNAKDRTVASAYSVRPTPGARVSAPLSWDEVELCDPRDFTLKTMPARFKEIGDRHEGIDAGTPCSLEALLELSKRHEKEGLGDAELPPFYRKEPGEPPRVQPSRRRMPIHPLIEIGRAQKKEDVLAGLERWKARHPDVAPLIEPADVLVDSMRGRFQSWWRIRVNLQHVSEPKRPAQEALDPDDEPKVSWPGAEDPKMMEEFRRWRAQTSAARRKAKREEEAAAEDAPAGGEAAERGARVSKARKTAVRSAESPASSEAAASDETAGGAASGDATVSETSPRRRPSRARKPS